MIVKTVVTTLPAHTGRTRPSRSASRLPSVHHGSRALGSRFLSCDALPAAPRPGPPSGTNSIQNRTEQNSNRRTENVLLITARQPPTNNNNNSSNNNKTLLSGEWTNSIPPPDDASIVSPTAPKRSFETIAQSFPDTKDNAFLSRKNDRTTCNSLSHRTDT